MCSSSSTPQSADRPHASTSFWRDVAHALKGEQHDYTKEKLNRAILLLAVPMVLEMVMESLFAIVDVFWVSRLGRDAVAVIGLTLAWALANIAGLGALGVFTPCRCRSRCSRCGAPCSSNAANGNCRRFESL